MARALSRRLLVEKDEGAPPFARRILDSRERNIDQFLRACLPLLQFEGQSFKRFHVTQLSIACLTASASCLRVKGFGRKAKSACPSRFFSNASSA
jgi:hypothetical protein